MRNELDELLRHALTPIDEPESRLNQNIINQVKERERMNKRIIKRIPAAVLTAVIVLGCVSATVYAVRHLSIKQIIERNDDKKLVNAFSGKDAILINATQSYGGYDVTLLGIASGEDLSEYELFDNGIQLKDRTYCVVAIEHTDGTPMADTSEEAFSDENFFVSPLIKDFNPLFYNAFLFDSAHTDIVENGVRYRIMECNNVEIFADHGLYLCVCNGGSDNTATYNSEAYQFDETTGIIKRNEDYNGLNALFNLPIDVSKADEKAAQKFLQEIGYDERERINLDKEIEPDLEENNLEDRDKWRHLITPDNISLYADRIEDSVQILTPDENGFIHYEYRGGSSEYNVSELLDSKEKFIIKGFAVGSFDGIKTDEAYIDTLQANDDGTITYACYCVKQSVLENQ